MNAHEKGGVSSGLNSLSLWGLQGPTSQHLFLEATEVAAKKREEKKKSAVTAKRKTTTVKEPSTSRAA